MEPNWKHKTVFTGDNLYVMRGMNSGSVDLIYLDPPFNSNRAYAAPIGSEAAGAAFKDTWTLSDVDLVEHNRLKEEDVGLYTLMESAKHLHSKGMFSYLVMMAVRLIEMHRLLKDTGSIYLHCDPTANSYLKLLMDAVFGARQFRTEIIWKRTTAHSDTKQGRRQHGRIHDTLLFYTKADEWCWNPIFTEYDRDYIENTYRFIEPMTKRRYQKDNLTAAKPGGDTSYEWRVKQLLNKDWEVDLCDEWKDPVPNCEYKGVFPYKGRYWAYSKDKMREFALGGRLVYSRTGMPRYKRYLDEMPGISLQDMWTDIRSPSRKERLGYPTQKPLNLLDRIIRASSNEGDVVLDPFCGCATTMVVADDLGRNWVGIDISPKAVELVVSRIRDRQGLFGDITHRDDIPRRTDLGEELRGKGKDEYRKTLYGLQEGNCNGCHEHFQIRHFHMDHITPKAKGGTGHAENYQLLCGDCNHRKGTKSQAEFKALLAKEKGISTSWI